MQAAAAAGHTGSFGASSDWLLALIAQISGETPPGVGDELRLTEDLLLDSLGRIQLAAAIEQRLAIVTEEGALDRAVTLGELRAIVEGHASEQVIAFPRQSDAQPRPYSRQCSCSAGRSRSPWCLHLSRVAVDAGRAVGTCSLH